MIFLSSKINFFITNKQFAIFAVPMVCCPVRSYLAPPRFMDLPRGMDVVGQAKTYLKKIHDNERVVIE